MIFTAKVLVTVQGAWRTCKGMKQLRVIGMRTALLAFILAFANIALAQSEVANAAMRHDNAEVRRLLEEGFEVNASHYTGQPTTATQVWQKYYLMPESIRLLQIVMAQRRFGWPQTRVMWMLLKHCWKPVQMPTKSCLWVEGL